MQEVIQLLKLIDARQISKSMLYARQILFEYSDRPGHRLARILVEHPVARTILKMKKPHGTLTLDTDEKVEILANYYETLYISNTLWWLILKIV